MVKVYRKNNFKIFILSLKTDSDERMEEERSPKIIGKYTPMG